MDTNFGLIFIFVFVEKQGYNHTNMNIPISDSFQPQSQSPKIITNLDIIAKFGFPDEKGDENSGGNTTTKAYSETFPKIHFPSIPLPIKESLSRFADIE